MQSTKKFVCDVEGRHFATKAALSKHKSMVHPGCSSGGQSKSGSWRPRNRAPGNARRASRVSNSSSRRVTTGSDSIGAFELKSTTPLGTVFQAFVLTPLLLANTRFAAEAALYSRWRPKKINIKAIPSAGKMTSGSYTVGWTSDPTLWLKTGDAAINVITAMRPSVSAQIHQTSTLSVPSATTQKWYLCDNEDLQDSSHGKIFFCLSGSIGNLTGDSKISFRIVIDWTVEFDVPALPVPAGLEDHVYASSGYENYFVDSTNSWASGKKLSIKATSGGNLVPFVNLVKSAVYQIDHGSVLKDAKHVYQYASPIQDYGDNTNLALFVDFASAKAYAQSGNESYIADYSAAGEKVTPSNPAWILVGRYAPKPIKVTNALLEEKVQSLERMVKQLLIARNTSGSEHSFQMEEIPPDEN